MRRVPLHFLFLSTLAVSGGVAQSSYLMLFESAKVRTIDGLQRQRARSTLLSSEYRRFAYIYARGAASTEEFETAQTAASLADLDYRMADIQAKRAELMLQIASAYETTGRRVPVCKPVPQKDENSVLPLIKKLTVRKPVKIQFDPNPGTVVQISKAEAPEPPPVKPPDPPKPPDLPDPPPVKPPDPPVDPDIEPPPQEGEKPKPNKN